MILVKITMNVRPEKHQEITQTLLSMIESTEKEAGCLSYAVSCDIENKNRFNVLEEWKTRDDLNRYLGSHRFGVLLGIKTLLFEPPDIQINTVSKSEGMEAVHAVRDKNG